MNIKILSSLTSVTKKRNDMLTIGTHNGGDIFDHHQAGFNKTRENGIKYASAGLVWKSYGKQHCFSFISSFLPLWFNNSIEDFNNQFYKALLTTITVLEEELKTLIGSEVAKNIIMNNWSDDNFFANGILELPSQTIDWVETVVNINDSNENNLINFVIFPYPNGAWVAQCVPLSFTEKFSQRIAFPS